MNLPNKLTLIRIILVPFFVLSLLIAFPHHYMVSLIIFIAASITDCLDGQIARKRNMITDFGKFADPLADKILVISALVCFVELGIISAWPVIIVLFREFTVTSIRLIASSKGKVVAANIWGKMKTVSQMIAIILVMVLNYSYDLLQSSFNTLIDPKLIESIAPIFTGISAVAIWISTVFAVISGVIYIMDNKEFISDR